METHTETAAEIIIRHTIIIELEIKNLMDELAMKREMGDDEGQDEIQRSIYRLHCLTGRIAV